MPEYCQGGNNTLTGLVWGAGEGNFTKILGTVLYTIDLKEKKWLPFCERTKNASPLAFPTFLNATVRSFGHHTLAFEMFDADDDAARLRICFVLLLLLLGARHCGH